MKNFFLILVLFLLSSCSETVDLLANDPIGYAKAIFITAAAVGLIFVIFAPLSAILNTFLEKTKLGDSFFGWLIGAIVISFGLILMSTGVKFLFGL